MDGGRGEYHTASAAGGKRGRWEGGKGSEGVGMVVE